MSSKSGKQQSKNAQLLASLKSAALPLLCTVGLLYTLLTVVISSELLIQMVSYQDAAIIYIALATLVLLVVSRALRWTWPSFVEEPLIFIFAWALLSMLLGSYTLCGNGVAISSEASLLEGDNDTSIAQYIHGVNDDVSHTHALETPEGDEDWLARQLDHYGALSSSCNAEAANIVYSVLMVLALLCAALCDVRSYWLALLFRLATVILFIPLVLIPVGCNRYKLLDPSVVVIKIALCFILWLYCHHKRNTEDLLERCYGQSLRSLRENLHALQKASLVSDRRRDHELVESLGTNTRTPAELFDLLERACRFVRQTGDTGTATEDEEDESSSEQSDERLRRLSVQRREMRRLCRVNDEYYTNTWFVQLLSWKNRGYSRPASALQDLVNVAWVLFVCPPFLLVVLLELPWLLWRIRVNESELLACEQMHTVLSQYGEKEPRDFNALNMISV